MNYTITYSNGHESVLAHHGIKGQKWGERRYQYEDGTYTAEGKARRRNDSSNDKDRDEKKGKAISRISSEIPNVANRITSIYERSAKKPASKAKTLSDEELRKRVNRLNLEQQYDRLTSDEINAGRNNVKNTLATIGDIVAIAASAAAIVTAIHTLRKG